MIEEQIIFHSETYGKLSFAEALAKIVEFVKENPKRFYRIIVGTDSLAKARAVLPTAITVLRVGSGGIKFITYSEEKYFPTYRERLIQEAMNSIMLAQEARSFLLDALGDEFFWDGNEIHADVGGSKKSIEVADTIKGMIQGYGFVPVLKPHAFGASTVADRYT